MQKCLLRSSLHSATFAKLTTLHSVPLYEVIIAGRAERGVPLVTLYLFPQNPFPHFFIKHSKLRIQNSLLLVTSHLLLVTNFTERQPTSFVIIFVPNNCYQTNTRSVTIFANPKNCPFASAVSQIIVIDLLGKNISSVVFMLVLLSLCFLLVTPLSSLKDRFIFFLNKI